MRSLPRPSTCCAAVLILLGVTAITFALSYLVPADPVRMIAGRSATPETVESIRQQLGLDRPVWEQYGNYLLRLAQGDLGRSYVAEDRGCDADLEPAAGDIAADGRRDLLRAR